MWMDESHSGNIWLATKDGFYAYDKHMDELILIEEGFAWKIMVYEDREGNVWVGSSGDGLDRYDPVSGEWVRYAEDPEDTTSLSNNFVETIHEDSSGTLWLGTGGGLNRFDHNTGTFTHFRTKDGLAHDYIMGILEDSEGHLWLSTLDGLSKFDPASETFSNYDPGDGVQSNMFWRNAYHQRDNGEMIFGGENGFNIFHPNQISANPIVPAVIISQVDLFNEPILSNLDTNDQLELGYKENFLSFDFVALDYNNPEKNQFAYQMIGLDEEWILAGTRRHADYPDLEPGEYTFQVMGSNDDGVWNKTPAQIQITIQPPFWATWWFRALAVTTIAGAVYAAFRLRVRNLQTRSRELERLVEVRTSDLAEANELLAQERAETAVANERTRLARDLHDAVTQTLFSASLLAEALPTSWDQDPEEGRVLLRDIRQLSRGALAEMRGLLHELRPTTIAETSLKELLGQLAEAVAGREGIPVSVGITCSCVLPEEVHVALYRIAQESLNNIVKHARASEVSIKLDCSKCMSDGDGSPVTRNISLLIGDNGRGFELGKHMMEGMGLSIMRERAESVGADMQITSQPGEGTRIEVVWEGMEKEDDGKNQTD
jgi:signal transduction histidine kinase